jgi:hypothetical protein
MNNKKTNPTARVSQNSATDRKGVTTAEFHRMFRQAIREAGGVLVHPENAKATRKALKKGGAQ